jgi:RNA polymerase sigma-70 factor (ECF subfamily)
MPPHMLDPRSTGPAQPLHSEDTAQAVCRHWYQAYGEGLYRYLRFHLPSADLAEDLTAEVFLRALRRFDQFKSNRGSAKAWLFRIAQNTLRDHQRQARRRAVLPISGIRDLECEAPSPEERILWEEEVARLLSAMAGLPDKDREIIGLCYGSDLSASQAGEILGLTDTATRTRLWRALGRLRKALSR